MEISYKNYADWRGRGMVIYLDQQPDRATLTIKCNGQRVEVRGHPAVGTYYEGSRLDRIINSIPRKTNLSALFAGESRHISGKWATPIVDALEKEDEIQRRFMSSKLKIKEEPKKQPKHRDLSRFSERNRRV